MRNVEAPEGNNVAVLGENRRLLVFPLEQLAVLTRGTWTTLQRYKDGGLKAVRVFNAKDGLVWSEGAKARSAADLLGWSGGSGDVGKAPPRWAVVD